MELFAAIPERAILLLLLQFAAVLLTARLFGELMGRLGQPTVLGELLAGILLGPSVLGLYCPAFSAALFPPEALSHHLLELVSWLGLILLLFVVGLETDVGALGGLGRPALSVGWWALALPMASGIALGWALPDTFMGPVGSRMVLALFLGVAMSITAIPVLAKILLELDMLRRNFGLAALGAGIAEDLLGWIGLSVVLELARDGRADAWAIGKALSVTSLFIALAFVLGRRAVPLFFELVDERLRSPHRRVTVAILFALLCSALTQRIGVHAVFGAFVAGLLVGRCPRFKAQDREVIEGAAFGVFAPVFFSFAGLQVRLHELREWGLFGVILGAAVAGKLLGAYVGGRLGGFRRLESLAMGIGMNARGSMELVLALLGLSAGIVSRELFSMIVLMAAITSLMTPPLLRLIAPHIPLAGDELERIRRQERESRAFFKKSDMKLLVPTAAGPNAAGILALVSPLVRAGRAALTLLMVRAPGRSLKEKVLQLLRKDSQSLDLRAAAERLAELARQHGIAAPPKLVTREARQEAVLEEALQGYHLLILGAHNAASPGGGDFLEKVVAHSPIPTALFRGAAPLPQGFRRLLLPTKGDIDFPFVFEFAALLVEHQADASITVLHVAPGPRRRPRWGALSALLSEGDGRGEAEAEAKARIGQLVGAAVAEHAAVATAGPRVEHKTLEAEDPVETILREARSGGYDLLLLGAVRHLVRERLFFGHKVDELARRSPCSVLLVTPPRHGPLL